MRKPRSTQARRGRSEQRHRAGLRLLGCIAVTALLTLLAWQVITNISPRYYEATSGTSIAIAPGSSSAALARQVELQIMAADEAVDWAAIRRTAQQILHAHPLDSRAIYLLGLAAEAEGREADATTLMNIAATRSLRNRGAHLWLFMRRLEIGKVGPALHHADVMLRTRPQLGAILLPILMAVASTPEGIRHLAKMFNADHPWRGWFLREFAKAAADPSDPFPLYDALQVGSSPPGSAELRPYIDRLIGEGRFEQALVIWKKSLAPDELQDIDYLYNGDFERPNSNIPFEWIISQPRGAEIDVSDSPFGKGKALRIQFARARIAFRHVRKLVMLPPGGYRLSGRAKTVDLSNERGLVWKLTCAGGSTEVLGTTTPVTGTMTLEIMQQFTVPQGCQAQWLELQLAARIPSEQDVGGGTVWYDSLGIRRIDGELPTASGNGISD